jgi:hypothetical protein
MPYKKLLAATKRRRSDAVLDRNVVNLIPPGAQISLERVALVAEAVHFGLT